jgi:hypothetical protein
MKVNIGKHKNWFGPFQLAEFLCFWSRNKIEKPDYIFQFGHLLAYGRFDKKLKRDLKVGERISFLGDIENGKTWLYRLMEWVYSKQSRTVKVHIDRYDVWNADETLAYIILPLLKELKKDKHGAPFVDDEDVPEEIRSTSTPPKENRWDVDNNHFKRWDYVLDEIIFSFECKIGDKKDWEDQFYSGISNYELEMTEEGTLLLVGGDGHSRTVDMEGRKAYQERITNGFRLFGKYYESMWT